MGSSPSRPEEEQVSRSRYHTEASDFTECAHRDYHYHSGESSRDNNSIPKAKVDWRMQGAISPIKTQRGGSCWAVSTIDLLESFFKIRSGKMVPLSVQHLIDCCDDLSCGFFGGDVEEALSFVSHYGIATEEQYPFKGYKGICKPVETPMRIQGYKQVTPYSEAELEAAVDKGPVMASVASIDSGFQHYSGGMYDGPERETTYLDLNHVVIIVGHGKVPGGDDFWLVKNSWGTRWGHEGYMMMKKGSHHPEGTNGITLKAFYPY